MLLPRILRRRPPPPRPARPPITVYVGTEPCTVDVAWRSPFLVALGPVFHPEQIGQPVTGPGVPAGTTLVLVTSARNAMMSTEFSSPFSDELGAYLDGRA